MLPWSLPEKSAVLFSANSSFSESLRKRHKQVLKTSNQSRNPPPRSCLSVYLSIYLSMSERISKHYTTPHPTPPPPPRRPALQSCNAPRNDTKTPSNFFLHSQSHTSTYPTKETHYGFYPSSRPISLHTQCALARDSVRRLVKSLEDGMSATWSTGFERGS